MSKSDVEKLREQGLDVQTVGEIIETNDAAAIGHNNPPEITPFEAIKQEIDDLVLEARNWLDGEGVSNEDQASNVAILRDKLRDAAKRAEELRKAEAKPFDDGKAAVQARFNPLIQKDRGLCDIAIQTCNNVLKPFLKAKDDAQRAEAARLQREAQEAAAAAQRAAREAADTQDIGKREDAEALLADARALIGDAKRADAVKPQVAGSARAVGLKSVFTPELVDPATALAHYRTTRPGALKEWLIDQARIDVRGGHHAPDAIPGFTIKEDRVPV